MSFTDELPWDTYGDLDDEQPSESRCMYCGKKIVWHFEEDEQKWRPYTVFGNKHHCTGLIPGPEQDFEVLK